MSVSAVVVLGDFFTLKFVGTVRANDVAWRVSKILTENGDRREIHFADFAGAVPWVELKSFAADYWLRESDIPVLNLTELQSTYDRLVHQLDSEKNRQ